MMRPANSSKTISRIPATELPECDSQYGRKSLGEPSARCAFNSIKQVYSYWHQSPDTLGFIIVDEPSKYGLYGGYPVGNTSESKKPENSEIYCISMFHQLHCLVSSFPDLLRHDNHDSEEQHKESVWGIKRSTCILWRKNSSSEALSWLFASGMLPMKPSLPVSWAANIEWQGVMCAGDLTLEKSVVVNGELDRSVDGWGVIHECKNWNSMYDIASVMGML